jgi:alpha-beta hydrolase superfamily lysophospholipase
MAAPGGGAAPTTVRQKVVRVVAPLAAGLVAAVVLTALVVPWWAAVAIWVGVAAVLVAAAAAIPVRTAGLVPRPAPCASFDEAMARLDSGVRAREREGMHPLGVTRLWHHGRRTDRVAVLFHGLSNGPHSMVELGPRLHAAGWTVLAPRLPRHGHADLATDALRRLTAEELRDAADEAVDVAAGLGRSVVVLGISGGGVVAAWAGQFRPEVGHSVLVAPMFGLGGLGPRVNWFLVRLALLLPSVSLWKDARLKADFPGLGHNYKRMHTRAVGETGRLGVAVRRAARRRAPAAASAALLTNAADRAVTGELAVRMAALWQRWIPVEQVEFPASAGLGHEVVDPADPEGDVTVTYPVLLRLLGAAGT